MRVIIAGGRDINDAGALLSAVEYSGFKITEVVSGHCLCECKGLFKDCDVKGVDGMGERWAKWNNIPVEPFRADWDSFGKAAGPIRNGQMVKYAEALIAVWDGHSRGTFNMIKQADEHDLHVHIVIVPT